VTAIALTLAKDFPIALDNNSRAFSPVPLVNANSARI